MRVAVLADTHTMGPRRHLPSGAWPYIESADHILHAGDVCEPSVLDELASFAPVTAVAGNCDGLDVTDWGARERGEVDLGGVTVALLHDAGASSGRRRRLRSSFPGARVVVYGHSHLPCNDDEEGLLLLNPGSPTWPRLAPYPSMGLLWIDDGAVEADVFAV